MPSPGTIGHFDLVAGIRSLFGEDAPQPDFPVAPPPPPGSNHLKLLNQSGQGIHVMAAPGLGWAITDFAFDVAMLALGVTELKAIAATAELPATINTVAEFIQFLEIVVQLGLATAGTALRPVEAVQTVMEQFYKVSKAVPNGEAKDIYDKGFFDIYLSPSGLAGMMGAKTLTLIIISDDGKRLAHFDTEPDDTWTVTANNEIDASPSNLDWPTVDPANRSHGFAELKPKP